MIEKLNSSHAEAMRAAFTGEKFMGVGVNTNYFVGPDVKFMQIAYDGFCDTYLSGLKTYHAYGSIENGVVTSYFSFYESQETPDWYATQIRSIPNLGSLQEVQDAVIKHNEANGRFKFFSLFNKKYRRSIRKFMFSDWANERYDYFDEYIVPARTKCLYQTPWQVLFNRTLVPIDSIVRCTFLKQQYRDITPIAGSL